MVTLSTITIGDILSGSICYGSKKVDPDAILPFIIVPIILVTGTMSLTTTVFLMAMTSTGVLYVMSRPRKKNR